MSLASAALLVLSALGSQPGDRTLIRLEDPANDDKGPGSYTYPTGPLYRAGQFDLRRFEVSLRGDRARFELWLDAPIEPPGGHHADPVARHLENGIYLQNIDLYIDRDPDAGVTEALPGRNVRFEAAGAWDVAIVLTPQPFRVRSLLADWPPRDRVLVPSHVRSEGRRVFVEIPLADLGGAPEAGWGFQILVTGARWDESFDVLLRVAGEHQADALTVPVQSLSETDAFGGGALGHFHPRVIDLLSPPDRNQRAILSSWNEEAERLAVVPMVVPDRSARARSEAARAAARAEARGEVDRLPIPTLSLAPPHAVTSTTSWVEARVQSVEGELVVLERPTRSVKRLSIGVVLDREGRAAGRVVMTADYPQFLLATVVEGGSALMPGATVRFEPVKE